MKNKHLEARKVYIFYLYVPSLIITLNIICLMAQACNITLYRFYDPLLLFAFEACKNSV